MRIVAGTLKRHKANMGWILDGQRIDTGYTPKRKRTATRQATNSQKTNNTQIPNRNHTDS